MSEDKYVDSENVSVSEPQNESNTDSQKPLSIEDALAAAELAADELETMAAADGEFHTAKEKPETHSTPAQEIDAASFDPSMFAPEDVLSENNTVTTDASEKTAANEPVLTVAPEIKKTGSAAKTQTKKTAAKQNARAPKEKKNVSEKVDETAAIVESATETIAEPATENLTEETIKTDVGTAADKKTKSKKQQETPVQISERLRSKLSPEKNFRLLKILIIVLSVLCAAIAAYIYIFHIYDNTTPFNVAKLIPLIPFAAQLLLLFITLITAGTSKRRPIGATIKENIQIKQEVKEMEKEAQITKEIADNLLVPEVKLSTRKNVELSNFQIDNYYKKNIEEINGKYYMQVAKFDDSVKVFNALGATDMELCAVNMVGSAKFDEILDQPRTKTLSSSELVTYFLSKPHVFAIKKRGSLDWTFKYSSKSFGIIRENEDSYKVSVKCYPDAATRLNDVYKALEDSNFPSGPLWYCFNELRNLPPRVCKWLVDTSCQISMFQQTKTDKLKENVKTAKDYDIDIADIKEKFAAGEKVVRFPKFTMIFSKGNDADLTTYLTRECEGVDASAYTKEYYYKFTNSDNAVSILCPTKGLSEEVIIAIFDEIEKIVG